jgi:hypothetical protein
MPDSRDLLCAGSILFLFLIYCFVLDHGRPHHYTIILPFLSLALSEGIVAMWEAIKPAARYASAVRALVCVSLISYSLQYPLVALYVDANNGSSGQYGVSYREQRNAAKKISALAIGGRIVLNPLAEPGNSFSALRREELQQTIAYICKTEFGREVLFTAGPEPGGRVLRLIKTGNRLHFEIDD